MLLRGQDPRQVQISAPARPRTIARHSAPARQFNGSLSYLGSSLTRGTGQDWAFRQMSTERSAVTSAQRLRIAARGWWTFVCFDFW
jgi:hypothetical protein